MPDNPFSALLDPSKQGTISGFVGGLMGSPTLQQAQGSATGTALQELSALKDANGGDNQKALMQFFQSPSGHDYFANAGPDGLKQLADGLQAMTPPAPTQNVLAPGAALASTDRYGRSTITANNPQQFPNQVLGPQDKLVNGANTLNENTNQKGDVPADVRSFNFFTQLAGLPKAEVMRLAGLKADPTKGGPDSVMSNAIDKLVSDYGLDPKLGEAMKGGQVKVLPLKNSQGQDTGDVSVVDLTGKDGPTVQVLRHGAGAGASASGTVSTAGTTPSAGAATGVLPAVDPAVTPNAANATDGTGGFGPTAPRKTTTGNPAFGTKNDMALGAGPVSKILGAATTASEAIDPRLIIDQGAQAKDRETLLGTLRSTLQAVGTIGGGMSSNKALIDGYQKNYLDEGFFSSPHGQVQKLIRLSEAADKNIAEETARANDGTLPHEVQKEAFEKVAAWQRVKSAMPDYDTLIQTEAAIRNGTAGAPTVVSGAKALVDAAGKGLTEVKSQGKQLGVTGDAIDINSMNDPQQLLALDPKTLNPTQKKQLIYKLGKMKRGG